MKNSYQHIQHMFPPVYDENSKILILGSFPSVKSRESGFFYGHPQNRFWKILAKVCDCELPDSIERKKEILLKNQIAIWDVIDSCDIIGSSDSSIKNVIPADILWLVQQTHIDKVFTNGKLAGKLYRKYIEDKVGISAIELPSTSPANASYSLERLWQAWKDIIE